MCKRIFFKYPLFYIIKVDKRDRGVPVNRDEARNKTVDLLLGDKNPNADFYASLFENYNYGDS